MTSNTRHGELSLQVDLSEHGELSHHGEFDPEQAAMLQDLARNGAPEAQMYGYPDAGANGVHLNGYGDGASHDMHSNGLLQSQQDIDLDDPAALLESLANFEHPPSSSNAPISNDHFASLLQAAATAGGQEAAQVDQSRTRRSTRQSRAAEQLGVSQYNTPENRSKRKKDNKPETQETHGFVIRNVKRKRVPDEIDDEEQLAREREIWGPEEPEEEDQSTYEPRYEHPPIGASDARAAGVHSAAALFRRPSSASKKYTRPPMSKLFTSLELTPEQFLHLQAAAKVYMLDPDHPERRDCVGNRGRSDTDMVKLKLFGCVKSFLEDEGWGDRCFGPDAEGAESRKLRWPQMKNKVISLVTPLLRRMVTNERQRQYAVETRKSTNTNPASTKITNKKTRDNQSATYTRDVQETQSKDVDQSEPSPQYPDIDPKLDQYRYTLDPSFTATDNVSKPAPKSHSPDDDALEPSEPYPASPASKSTIHYHINILHNGVRILPRVALTPLLCPGLSSLVQHVNGLLNDKSAKLNRVQILGADGLREVDGEEAWLGAVKGVADCDWMDGEVKVVVEVSYDMG